MAIAVAQINQSPGWHVQFESKINNSSLKLNGKKEVRFMPQIGLELKEVNGSFHTQIPSVQILEEHGKMSCGWISISS
jgi:hypothetical protein